MRLLIVFAIGLPVFAQSAIQVSEIRLDRPTLVSLGLQVLYSGDTNRNATASLRYRQLGQTTWRNALPMLRVRPETVTGWTVPRQFAGSVLDLRPATTYELEVHVQDLDGPVNQTFLRTATTRPIPTGPATPRNILVNSVASLENAVNAAQPGDVITIQPGVYPLQWLRIENSGTPSAPIVIRGSFNKTVILDGGNCDACNVLEVYGSYVQVESLTIRNAYQAIRFQGPGATGNVFRRNIATNVKNGINGQPGQTDFYIADNIFEGQIQFPLVFNQGNPDFLYSFGIDIYGSGGVVAHNQISGFFDAIQIPENGSRSVDLYGNDIRYSYDDGIEMDNSEGNIRVFRNRLTNTNSGISSQPVYGGPAYVYRNIASNVRLEPIKIHSLAYTPTHDPSGVMYFNNTFLSNARALSNYALRLQNSTVSNNIFLGPSVPDAGIAVEFLGDFDQFTLDYNGYWPDGLVNINPAPLGLVHYPNLAAASAGGIIEPHSTLLSANTLASGMIGPNGFSTFQLPQMVRLAPGSPALDRGRTLPNITDDFFGSAPDLGAIEAGCAPPHYGPRPPSLDESNHAVPCAVGAEAAPQAYKVRTRPTGSTAEILSVFADANGFADIATISVSNGTSTSSGCVVEYDRTRNGLYLWNDAGTARLGPVAPGGGSIENNTCRVNGNLTTVDLDSESSTLTMELNVTKKQAIAWLVYTRATDVSGLDSGWVRAGKW